MRTLSGGNQQKALLARWHLADADDLRADRADARRRRRARAPRSTAGSTRWRAPARRSSWSPPTCRRCWRSPIASWSARRRDRRRDDAGGGRRGAAQPDGPGSGRGMTPALAKAERGGRAWLARDGRAVAARRCWSRRCCSALVFAATVAGLRHARQRRQHPAPVGLGAGARPRDGDRGAGRRHRPLGRLGGARLGDARRHRAGRGTAAGAGDARGRSASARRSGSINAALIEGLRISPVIVTLGTMIAVRGLSLVRARPLQFLGRDQRPALHRPRPPHASLGVPLDALVARWRGRARLVRHCAARSSAAPGTRSATRRSPRGSPACACAGCAPAPMSPAARWPAPPASWSRRAPA